MQTPEEFWAWVDTVPEREFWEVYDIYANEPAVPTAVLAAMDDHAHYLVMGVDDSVYQAQLEKVLIR